MKRSRSLVRRRPGYRSGAGDNLPIVPRATARATVSQGLVGLWMALLFAGWAAGGLTHLLLLAALGIWPWRALAPRREQS
jgi:hypothetical protein